MEKTKVLIVGAGPTGLVLALWLTKIGVPLRIIDKSERAGTTSRAIVIHARNLEFYHQLGLAEMAVEKGIEIKAGNLWKRGEKVGHLPLTDLDLSLSPYQFMLGLPQDQQEEMLQQQLAHLGVAVERNTELVSFEPSGLEVRAKLRKVTGEIEECEALYLAGCDGAHSIVREQMGAKFPGGTYEEIFYVADLTCKGMFAPGEVNIALDDADFLAIFPLKGRNEQRLVGTIRHDAMEKQNLEWKDVRDGVIKRLKIEVEEMRWFSTYRVHHRVASHFRDGRVFLLGDAGHLHSPVGGQGMNTGIGDAVNLAWKIGAVLSTHAPARILDTYEPERIAFARRLVVTTDQAFTFVTARGSFATWIRLNIVPVLVPWLAGFVAIRRMLFRTISQLFIHYRESALSQGAAGIRGGDRLPWVKLENGGDNFASLTTLSWQAHIYGTPSISVQLLCDKRAIKLNVFPWSDAFAKTGLKKHAIYIVRPDGYVGMAARDVDSEKIAMYCDTWGVISGLQ